MTMLVLGKREVGLALVSVVFAPSLVMMFGHASSLASGMIIAALMIVFMSSLIVYFRPTLAFFSWSASLQIFVVIFVVLFHYLLSGFFVSLGRDSPRLLGSVAALILFLPSAYIVATSLINLQDSALRRILGFIFFILLLNAIISLTRVDYFSLGTTKPAFLFAEPSHFALIAAPFIIYYMKSRLAGWKFGLLVFLSYAIYIENLTMLVVVLVALIVSFKLKRFLLLLPFLLVIFISFANVDYFIQRLVLSVDGINNISLIVVLQGWQNALLTFLNTSGFGAGFQQLGIATPTGELTEMLIELSGSHLNSFDGGSTAAKLFGEFGLFGVALILFLIVRAAKAYSALNRVRDMSDLFIFSRCVEIAILIELFVRGIGYFSPGIFLYLVVIYCENLSRREKFSQYQISQFR